ncbi:putative holin-like toxin [Shouchella lonarensis]|nr:putative holin-like toxin [Shouchella lonarensis]
MIALSLERGWYCGMTVFQTLVVLISFASLIVSVVTLAQNKE